VENPCELAGEEACLVPTAPKFIAPIQVVPILETQPKPAVVPAGDETGVATPGVKSVEVPCELAVDLRTYQFKYRDRPWAKAPGMRQLIVVATNPEGKSMEVAALTDDPKRLAIEVLKLLFNRWLQENDFKYEDKHFGINQITSYRRVPYEKLKGQLQDRQVKSGQAKALSRARLDLERQQKRLLRWTGQTFEVHLLPRVNYPPALQAIILTLLEQLNAKQPQLPDGSHRPLKFYLSDREDFEIRLKGTD
jgi:hypothetical protein